MSRTALAATRIWKAKYKMRKKLRKNAKFIIEDSNLKSKHNQIKKKLKLEETRILEASKLSKILAKTSLNEAIVMTQNKFKI